MKKQAPVVVFLLAAAVAIVVVCSSPSNPFANPKAAKIVSDSSLTSLKDSAAAFTTVPCTVSLYLPNLIDSFSVIRRIGAGADSAIASGAVTSSQISFVLPLDYPGVYTVKVRIVKNDNSVDSLTRTITVSSPYSVSFAFVSPHGDSLLYHHEYACSCSVSHPEFADSISAHLTYGNFDTVIARAKITQGFVFRITAPVVGGFSLRAVATVLGGGQDSITKNFTGYVLFPTVTADSSAFHVTLPLDSFTFKFSAFGPDSNLRLGYTWLDTAMGQTVATAFTSLKPLREPISRTVKNPALMAALRSPLICHAYAIDADSLVSAVASCTLFVKDTTKPKISLLIPSTTDTIRTLPLPVKAIITDLVGISSVKFNGSSMIFINGGDTAVDTISSIDSGKSIDSIVAVDNSGNSTSFIFDLNRVGKKLYPPQIVDLSRATTEGNSFKPILLDSFLIINDPSITNKLVYARDSILWQIRDSAGKLINYDLNTHLFTVPFPSDSEWTGTIKLTFKAWVINTPTLYDTKQPSFFVTEVYDPPVVTYPQSICSLVPHSDTIYLDTITTVRALDNAYSDLNWSFKPGKHFKVDSLYRRLLAKTEISSVNPVLNPGVIIPPIGVFIFNRHIVIAPIAVADSGYYGIDTLNFTVTSPQGGVSSKPIYFSHSHICLFHFIQ